MPGKIFGVFYSGESSMSNKEDESTVPYELFNIKTKAKTEIAFKLCFTLVKICRL